MIYTNEMIKKELDRKKKIKKVLKYCYMPIVILIVFGCISIAFQKFIEKNDFVDFLGFKAFIVLTGSMEPEISAGDVVIINNVNQQNVRIGDIITYSVGGTNQTVTHRVIEITQKNGKTYYKTKGDNNNSTDSDLVEYEQIIGTVSFTIGKIGLIVNALKTTGGIAFVILILLVSWVHSSKLDDRILAREETRKRHNICKYKKYGEDANGTKEVYLG